jgi:hypothetical protein
MGEREVVGRCGGGRGEGEGVGDRSRSPLLLALPRSTSPPSSAPAPPQEAPSGELRLRAGPAIGSVPRRPQTLVSASTSSPSSQAKPSLL